MKYKTIKITEELHKKLKEMCDERGLKLNRWCNAILLTALTSHYVEKEEKKADRDI